MRVLLGGPDQHHEACALLHLLGQNLKTATGFMAPTARSSDQSESVASFKLQWGCCWTVQATTGPCAIIRNSFECCVSKSMLEILTIFFYPISTICWPWIVVGQLIQVQRGTENGCCTTVTTGAGHLQLRIHPVMPPTLYRCSLLLLLVGQCHHSAAA